MCKKPTESVSNLMQYALFPNDFGTGSGQTHVGGANTDLQGLAVGGVEGTVHTVLPQKFHELHMAGKVKAAWAWTGYKGMQRLYVRVFHENRVLWMNQRRPYNWGEKDAGSLDLFDMKDIEQQTLKLYGCETLDELSKVRDSRYAYGRK